MIKEFRSNDLFYGLPGEIWEDLCSKAEDILHDESIGQHLLGVYPVGPRMYGLESESPQILCIYMDTPKKFLNPIVPSDSGYKSFNTGNSNSYIHFVDIYNWINDIYFERVWPTDYSFFEVAPIRGHYLYVDENMAKIAGLIDEFLSPARFLHGFSGASFCKRGRSVDSFLYTRAKFILTQTGTYAPCINLDWDNKTFMSGVPKIIQEEDRILCNVILKTGFVPESLTNKYVSYLADRIEKSWKRSSMNIDHDKIEEAANIVEEMYRFQL